MNVDTYIFRYLVSRTPEYIYSIIGREEQEDTMIVLEMMAVAGLTCLLSQVTRSPGDKLLFPGRSDIERLWDRVGEWAKTQTPRAGTTPVLKVDNKT